MPFLAFQRTGSSMPSTMAGWHSARVKPGIAWPLAASVTSASTRPRQESQLMCRRSPVTLIGLVDTEPHSGPPFSETKPSMRKRARQRALPSRYLRCSVSATVMARWRNPL